MGTAHVLEACKSSPSVKAVVIVTSDKCYENLEQEQAYKEDDRLGGHDIYSTSKACAELVTSGYRDAFFTNGPMVATARAGNVIGGGDWSADRLIPDAVRAIFAREELKIRYPDAIRPWQHVLDPLCGYLLLAEGLYRGDRDLLGAFNFGPTHESAKTVKQVVSAFFSYWPEGPEWLHFEDPEKFHEARLLSLDFSKAHNQLNWSPALDLASALELTATWYMAFRENPGNQEFMREITRASITEYVG
jgi:CDP-glucose 4,6-dehydratase